MSLKAGTRVGPYEVSAKIGEGGMGEVYRARDTKLDRDVALKVLPEAFTSDPDRLARFEREAKVLATLNHPNIAAIYGIEETDGTLALVLELVEGPTLAERIARGPIPLDEALPIARQIAEALEAAHERGIVHRDLKPANVKVRDDGTVKVLDFGLAKAAQPDASGVDMASSPTASLTVAATQMGMVIGTAAYMAPEQAKGKVVDKRADIWAFGAVLFEMLTGARLFAGGDISETLAFVIMKDVEWTALPAETPAALRHLLQRCLERDPKRRLRDIGEARIGLDDPSAISGIGVEAPADLPRLGVWQRPVPAAVLGLGLLLGGLAVGVWGGAGQGPSSPLPVRRLSILVPPEAPYVGLRGGDLAVSPDGARLVYAASIEGGTRLLYLRELDQLDPVPIQGTEGAWNPFFSPNGEWVAFFADPESQADGRLKKVSIRGGAPLTLCDTFGVPTGSWGANGEIVFTERDAGGLSRLFRVSAAGGTPERLTAIDSEDSRMWPHVLPGGQAVLFSVFTPTDEAIGSRIEVLSVETGDSRTVIEQGVNGRYVQSGHIVYMLDDTLMAAPFDVGRLETTGPAAPVVEGILALNDGSSSMGISDSGLLVYVPGAVSRNQGQRFNLVWVDRQGREELLPTPPQNVFLAPRVSPDGGRVAVTVVTGGTQADLWVYDVATGAGLRLTHDGGSSLPIWTSNGEHVVFSSTAAAPPPADFTGQWFGNLYRVPADGSGPPERLTTSEESQGLTAVSPDGQTLLYTKVIGDGRWDIMSTAARGGGAPEPVVSGPFRQGSGALSPDGRWLAYRSDEAGQFEIYVQPYPGPGPKIPVSVGGGQAIVWAHDGRELFYRVGDQVRAVEVELEPAFRPSAPRTLFEGRYFAEGRGGRQYHVAPDGRFLMIRSNAGETGDDSDRGDFVAVFNWFQELKERVPVN